MKITKNSKCVICGDKALHIVPNNVVSCRSCSLFFKKYYGRQFQCSAFNDCDMNKETRNCCLKCRMDKCLALGMVLDNSGAQSSSLNNTTKEVAPQVDTSAGSSKSLQAEVSCESKVTSSAADWGTESKFNGPMVKNPVHEAERTGYPVHPDVRLKKLPFYDILAELLKPTSLMHHTNKGMQTCHFYIYLTPQQASEIAGSRTEIPPLRVTYSKQVQMRFCLLETTCEQEDCFPPNVTVKVNRKNVTLPNFIQKQGVPPKRPSIPLDITTLLHLNPKFANTVTIQWMPDFCIGYSVSINLVQKVSSSDLLQRLKMKGVKHSDYTRSLIKEKLNNDDCEIVTTCLKVSLTCPLGRTRMSIPCRSISCLHLQCFDALLFLQMNEKKPKWNCPVCDKAVMFDQLVIDGYFQEVLNSPNLPFNVNEIQLHRDGSWNAQAVKKEIIEAGDSVSVDASVQIIEDDVEIISSDVISSSDKPKTELKLETPRRETKQDVVDLTLSDSDEDDQPLSKLRALNPKPDSTDEDSLVPHSVDSSVIVTAGPSGISRASPEIIELDSSSSPEGLQVDEEQIESPAIGSTTDDVTASVICSPNSTTFVDLE